MEGCSWEPRQGGTEIKAKVEGPLPFFMSKTYTFLAANDMEKGQNRDSETGNKKQISSAT